MEKILKKLTYTIAALVAVIVFIFSSFIWGGGVGSAYAATSTTEVLADLRKDPDFDESEYPYVKDDYGLHVIQIAESGNKELFVYAYQPCHDTYDLVGMKISISYGYSVNGAGLSPKLYNLRLVSTSGTLDKYYVENFTVPNDGDRYYNIVEIFRMINTEIDGEQDSSNPKTDKACPVGQQWYVCDLNVSKHYEMNTFDTMLVDKVFSGNIIFSDGLTWGDIVNLDKPTDCWFYCFNVEEYKITRIFDADLNYSIRDSFETFFSNGSSTVGYTNERENLTLKLTDKDVMSYISPGLGAPNLSWNRILSSVKFIEIAESQGVTFSEGEKSDIKKSQWVFTFLETDRVENNNSSGLAPGIVGTSSYSDVYDVGVLHLHFQDVSGKYYDLGVVNDLTDPDNIADGRTETDLFKAFEEFWNMFVKIILAIAGVILLVLLLNFVTPVMGILKYAFKAVVYVISLPFKLLKSIFKKDG